VEQAPFATTSRGGLTSDEALILLSEFGPNVTAEEHPQPWRTLLAKLWAPVPWMLELAILVELWLGKDLEAGIIGGLLAFNALLSSVQERRAQAALDLLRRNLTVTARVLRDGKWTTVPSRQLVPGDYVHLRLGDVVPADVKVEEGELQADQSSLTGESLAVSVRSEGTAFAGTVVVRGEASGQVTATGSKTYYGRTAELVKTARTASHLQSLIMRIVRALVGLDFVLALIVTVYSLLRGGSLEFVLPFVVVILLASVPVALPATFALASALGSVELARKGILTTRLSAIEEAASMDVLATDKTGTITTNRLSVRATHTYGRSSETDLLRYAAAASDPATQDPIDLAVLAQASAAGAGPESHRARFTPFDPATKRSEALVTLGGAEVSVVKGAPEIVLSLCQGPAPPGFERDIEAMADQGMRVLAVAAGPHGQLGLAGLIGLQDPPRPDSANLIRALVGQGIRVLMITGDGIETARAIAAQVGIHGAVCPEAKLREGGSVESYAVFAGVLPEDKFALVKRLQDGGSVVGMTGDGVNDAPALRQAEVGIAVSAATDVAKAAASLVLTDEGLAGIVSAVETSRQIYQRMLTYALNASIKKFEIPLFLSIVMLVTGRVLLTPLLMVLLFVTNDFATMSITTDRVGHSQRPDRWQVRQLLSGALGVAVPLLGGMLVLYAVGVQLLHLTLDQLRTLIFVGFVFTSQATIYLVREPRRLWASRPGWVLLAASVAAIALAVVLGAFGWLMAPLRPAILFGLLLAAGLYAVAVDALKVLLFRRLHLHEV
jgi:H+-transporting ATPase